MNPLKQIGCSLLNHDQPNRIRTITSSSLNIHGRAMTGNKLGLIVITFDFVMSFVNNVESLILMCDSFHFVAIEMLNE